MRITVTNVPLSSLGFHLKSRRYGHVDISVVYESDCSILITNSMIYACLNCKDTVNVNYMYIFQIYGCFVYYEIHFISVSTNY